MNYTNGIAVGSIATYTCNSGYRLLPEGREMRTCTRSGWDGQDVTCARGEYENLKLILSTVNEFFMFNLCDMLQ